MAKSTYLIMDGRANTDVHAAAVIEAFESKNAQSAQKYARTHYSDYDAVLVDANTNTIIYFKRN